MRARIAEIIVEFDEEGNPTYWAQWLGWHAAQGGMELAFGNIGAPDIRFITEHLSKKMIKDETDVINFVKDRIEIEARKESEK